MEHGVYWDPYDQQIDTNAHAVWAQLRAHAPVYWNDKYGFFALSRFSDVEAAHLNPAVFASSHGTVLERMSPEKSATGMMIFRDPPEHTRLRTLVSRAFTPRRVADLERKIETICAQLLDPLIGAGSFDYVSAFAAQLPSRVISHLVGVPPEDQESQRVLVDEMFHIEPDVGMLNDRSINAALSLVGYLADLVRERTVSPRDDLISAVIEAEIEDAQGEVRHLTADECTEFAMLLYTAGTETVAKLLGNAAVLLAAHPDQRQDLLANPDLTRNGVEEILRYEPPSPINGRWTLQDVTVQDILIREGSKVLLLTGSAGRDETAFPDADRFDVRRQMKKHLSFGYGIHLCLGAALARLEGRVGINETLRRFPDWEVDSDGIERVNTSTVRGYKSVPIVV
jgi:cytochrome P450